MRVACDRRRSEGDNRLCILTGDERGTLTIDCPECRLRRFELIELCILTVDVAGRVVECLSAVAVVVLWESGGCCDNFSLSKK